MSKSNKPNNEINRTDDDNPSIKVAKVGMWQAVIVALITTMGAGLIGYHSKSNAEGSPKNVETKATAVDTQNIIDRIVDSLTIRVALFDTETDRGRLTDLNNSLGAFGFMEVLRRGTRDSLFENNKKKPAIFIAHWHAYKCDTVDAATAEKELIKAINRYDPNTKIIVFSSIFNFDPEKQRFWNMISAEIRNYKDRVWAYYLPYRENQKELSVIVARVLSLAIDRHPKLK